MQTIEETIGALRRGKVTSAELTERAIAAAEDPDGEGSLVFTRHYAMKARAAAHAADSARSAGSDLPLLGIPISIKDLFDVAGETTLAGSIVRKGEAPATRDAVIVGRLRAAGAVIVGRTNMTEFAFSGLGINAHYGTPANPWDRANRRIPGGSSSGAAVSVTDGMAIAGIGTDTGGSVRIPSALCGLTGFKPTARRIPGVGAFPLSLHLDSIGPLAASVDCCNVIDAVLSGAEPEPLLELPVQGLRFGVPQTYVLDGLDEAVAKGFQSALDRLSEAGARLVDIPFEELKGLPDLARVATFPAAEAYYFLQHYLEEQRDKFDPQIAKRIESGAGFSSVDFLTLLHERRRLIEWADGQTAPFDALLMPTVPQVAPPISELEADDRAYQKANLAMLRNPTAGNLLERCAVSLPVHAPGDAPVGLMVMGETMGDRYCLALARAIESVVRPG